MKICYLSNSELPSPHANSVHVMKMCAALARENQDVLLIGKQGGKNTSETFAYYGVKQDAFTLKRFRAPRIRFFGQIYFSFCSLILAMSWRPDLLYARSLSSLFLCSFLNIPFAFEAHWPPRSQLQRRIESYLLKHRRCLGFVVISEALKKIYLDEFVGTSPSRFIVAHDAADLPEISGENFNSEVTEIGYLGSLYQGRGIEIIVGLAKKFPQIKFSVLGGLPDAVLEWKRQTSDQSNLHFYGHVAHSEIANHMSRWQIVLAPYQSNLGSLEWASPMKIFEYMAFKKPIICSRFPVFEEVLKDGFNSLLVTAHDVDDWAKAIKALENLNERKRISKQAYEDFLRHFQWQNRAQELIRKLAGR